ncbi:hypothetical protein CMV_014711 [Castanea mollissima]|uniref:Uncharacterized protein n=1 Tax=Castanea mollissima TaxID=60419 RepID=A0A8J4VTL5_9ROSI|nr:hypothetical protein CMV_014711 [Castanea mollissima]
MTNNPPNTSSTTNDDRLSALEVSTHSLKQQIEAQKEGFPSMKGAMKALANAITKMSRAMEEKGVRINEDHSSSGRDNVARVRHWPQRALVGSYVDGLKEEIRLEVKLFRPTTLLHATSLARLLEEKLSKLRRPSFTTTPPKPSLSQIPSYKPSLLPTPTPIKTTIPFTSSTRFSINTTFKKLSWAEMQARREKGLCYNCDERFGLGHRCKKQQIFLLETMDEMEENSGAVELELENEAPQAVPEISLHALSGVSTPRTMRQRWLVKLMGYDYEIEYKPGRENLAADALSRLHGELIAITCPQPTWLAKVHHEAHNDPLLITMREDLQKDTKSTSSYEARGG